MTQEKVYLKKLKIVKGPSKFDLMVSLFEGKKVVFTVSAECGTRDCSHRWIVEAKIKGIVVENAEKEIFSIYGETRYTDKYPDIPRCSRKLSLRQTSPFTGGYNAHRCGGFLRMEDEPILVFFSTEEISEEEKDIIFNYLNE